MNPHQKPQEDVVVTQEDRRQAANYLALTAGSDDDMWQQVHKVHRGDREDHPLVQSFARHRLLGHEAGRRDMREGWVLVPREPTEEMWRAGSDAFEVFEDGRHAYAVGAKRIWSAMLEALPTEPLGGGQP